MSVSAYRKKEEERKEERLALSRIKLLRSIKRCGNACPHATAKTGAGSGQDRQAWRHSQRGDTTTITHTAHDDAQHTAHDDAHTQQQQHNDAHITHYTTPSKTRYKGRGVAGVV